MSLKPQSAKCYLKWLMNVSVCVYVWERERGVSQNALSIFPLGMGSPTLHDSLRHSNNGILACWGLIRVWTHLFPCPREDPVSQVSKLGPAPVISHWPMKAGLGKRLGFGRHCYHWTHRFHRSALFPAASPPCSVLPPQAPVQSYLKWWALVHHLVDLTACGF